MEKASEAQGLAYAAEGGDNRTLPHEFVSNQCWALVFRQEEKDRLLKEMAALRAQMKELKQRAMRSFEPDKGAKEKDVANRVLRRTIQDHQNDTVQLDAIVSEYLLFVSAPLSFC